MAKLPVKASVLLTLSVCSIIVLCVIYTSTDTDVYPMALEDMEVEDDDVKRFDAPLDEDQGKDLATDRKDYRGYDNDDDEDDDEDELEIDESDYDEVDEENLKSELIEQLEKTEQEVFEMEDRKESAALFPDNDDVEVEIDESIFSSTESPSSTFESTVEASTEGSTVDPEDRKNVLFIMTDDMRPQLGAYNGEDFPMPYDKNKKMFTPNLDTLASRSILFKRAYVQYSLCGPSRTSMLTSRRPDTTRIFGNNNYWRDTGGNFTTLPQYFKNNGYTTIGIGKIFHKGKSSNKNDRKFSWSEKYYMPPYTDNHYLPNDKEGAGWRSVSAKEREKVPLSDEYSVIKAKEYMKKLGPKARTGEEPFFMAVGFKKPHLSLVCPEEYFDMYPLEEDEQYLPDMEWQTPAVKDTVSMGDEKIEDTNLKLIPDKGLRDLRRAYFACVSFVDTMVGKLVDELELQGLAKNTVVVFVADHGYHLGENAHWGKVTNYERATHVPLMIHIPGRTDRGIQTRSLVEAVDIYPTVAEAAGIKHVQRCPIHSSKVKTCTDGKSLLHLIDNPKATHKKVIYSQIASGGQFMSYTIRTDRYRFVEWAEVKKKPREDGLWDLYMDWDLGGWQWWTGFFDLKVDPEERFNRTADIKYEEIQLKMRNKLHKFVDRMYSQPKYFVKGH